MAAIWQIFDMDGQPVSEEIVKTGNNFDELDKSVDMRTFQRVEGTGAPQLENGHQYDVRCQLMESWFGYDKKAAVRIDDTTFRFYASNFDQSHIKFGITGVRQDMNASEFTLEVKGEDITPAYSTSITDRGYTPWMLEERMKIRAELKKTNPDCKIVLVVDENTEKKLADKVRQAKKDGLVDNFIYGSVSSTYLSAVIDAL